MSRTDSVGDGAITASRTLLAADRPTDATCPSASSSLQALSLHTSSQNIAVPLAAISASPNKNRPSVVDGR